MKFVNFILKFIGSIVGIMITSYVVALYFDFLIKTSLNEKNISKMISKIDLIDSSQTIFDTEDRIIERTINDINLGNLTYEDKKEIIYKSELYNDVQTYLSEYVYYFIGYEDNQFKISEEQKEKSKNDIEKLILQKTHLTDNESENLSKEIDKMYLNLEKINFSTLMDQLPAQYEFAIAYLKSRNLIYIEIIVLIVLMIINGLLMKNCSKPFKYLSIGLLFCVVISFMLNVVLEVVEMPNMMLNTLTSSLLDVVSSGTYICLTLLILSIITYVILLIHHKNKVADELGKTQINIENINIETKI